MSEDQVGDLTYLVIADSRNEIFNIRVEGQESYRGAMTKLTDGRFQISRYHDAQDVVPGNRVTKTLFTFFPDAKEFILVSDNGSRRPMKG